MAGSPEIRSDWDGDSQHSRAWWRQTEAMVEHGWQLFCQKRKIKIGLNMREIRQAEYRLFSAQIRQREEKKRL